MSTEKRGIFMKKKISISIAVVCTLNLFALSALADDTQAPAPSCGYEANRAVALKKKGDDRLAKALSIYHSIDANAQAGAAEISKDPTEGTLAKVKSDDKLMPEVLKQKTDCLVVIPSEKTVAFPTGIPFMSGGSYGAGIEICKGEDGKYDEQHPKFVKLDSMKLTGLAIGAEETDLVMGINKDNESKRKFSISGDASASGGKYGRNLSADGMTDGQGGEWAMSYSKSKGAYAGLTIDAGSLSDDKTMNAAYNGQSVPKENFFERLFTSSERKREDAACSQPSAAASSSAQALASAQAPADADTEDFNGALPGVSTEPSVQVASNDASVSAAKPDQAAAAPAPAAQAQAPAAQGASAPQVAAAPAPAGPAGQAQ
jgi:lipid-binding SYLF domain-containing protein